MKTFNKVIDIMQKIVLAVLTIIGVSMLAIAVVHIFFRFVLNNSLNWSEELLKILLVWFCLLSTSVIAVNREHVSIVIFKDRMPEELNQFFTLLSQVLIYLASVMVVYIGVRMVMNNLERGTAALQIPYIFVYGAVPISFLVISIYELRNLIMDFISYFKGEWLGEKDEHVQLDASVIAQSKLEHKE